MEIQFLFDLINQLIPHLVSGLGSMRNCQRITSILYDMLDFNAIRLLIDEIVIASSQDEELEDRELDKQKVEIKQGSRLLGILVFCKLGKDSITDEEKVVAQEIGKYISTQLTFNSKDYYSSLRSKAELKALQAQINPHFLFNALNTISAMCRTEPLTARKLLIHLSHYFRATIETSPDLIDIHKELNTISYYLEIEKARFGDMFDVEIKMPRNLSLMVPPLILQPLVENSIKHGLSGNIYDQGKIIIIVEPFEYGYEVSVEDNGKGMEEKTIEKVLSGGYGSERIGLYNVHQRLKEVYGEESGLIIESELGKGTRVLFKIPIRKRGENSAIKSYYNRR